MFKHSNFLIGIIICLMPTLVKAQTDTIALWTFESQTTNQFTGLTGLYGPISPETGSGNLTRECQNGAYSIVYSNPGNGSARSFNVGNWTTIGDYVQFETNTLGKSAIQLTFEQGGPLSGIRDFKVSYSTNGNSFTDLPNGNYQVTQMSPAWSSSTYQAGYSYNFVLPAILDNIPNAYIRISVTSDSTINNLTTTNVATNTRFDNILITGTPYVAARDTVAMWTFESQSGQAVVQFPDAYGPIPPEHGAGELTRNRQAAQLLLITYANPGNGTPKSLNSTTWTTIGDYIQFKVNTTGFADIGLSFEQGSASTTGPRDFKVSYSTDGTNFTDLPGGDYQQPFSESSTWSASTYQPGFNKYFSMPAALNNVPEAYIRLSTTSLSNMTGGAIANSGSSRMDNILITAIPYVPITQITNVATNDSTFCNAGSNPVSVSFNTNATTTTTYTAELSDASGSFAAPLVIGTGTTSPITATIPAATAAGGNYRIRVVATGATSQNAAGPITIDPAIFISLQLSDVIACEGVPVNFAMQSSNAQTYQWLYNGNPVANNPGYNQYTIPAVLPQHAGNYSVALSRGACADTSAAAVLTVNPGTIPANTTVSGSRFLGSGSNFPIVANNSSCGRLAVINALSNNLGNTTVTVTAGAPQQVGSNGPWHIGRYYNITPDNQPTGNVAVSLYFSPQDWDTYNLSAPASQQIIINQAAQTLGNLYFSELSSVNDLGTANGVVIAPDSVSFQNGYWKVSFTTNVLNSQSTFYAHGNNFVPCVAPTIQILETVNNVCSGTTVSFSSTITNQGVDLDYQWQVNGVNVVNTPSYTYTPVNGDIVTCILTKPSCFNPVMVTSNAIVMQVNPITTPGIVISTNDTNFCSGTQTTFTATANNAGTAPVYQWQVNSVNAGSNSATFSYTPNNGDIITCELTSNAPCLTSNAPVMSNTITMQKIQMVTASIVIAADNASVCAGKEVTFTATATNAGTTPVYQWMVNGANMGSNSATFSYMPNNSDIITCALTSNAPCLTSGVPALSNAITANVTTPSVAAVDITANPSSNATPGVSIDYTANITGTTVYSLDWYVNNQLVQQQQSPDNSFTTIAAAIPDTVYAVLKVNGCFTDSVYNSNELVVTSATSIPRLAMDLGLKFYPNPVLNSLTVEIHEGKLKGLQLVNIVGQIVRTENVTADKKHSVNLSHFASGIYYIKVQLTHQGKDYIIVEKIIKD